MKIRRMAEGLGVLIAAKLEFMNPGGSVKDRTALEILLAAERDGRLRPGSVVVEPTSGITGIALAMLCASRGLRLIVTMPESMSVMDEVVPVSTADAVLMAGRLAREEGILAGISSGAAIAAALRVARRPENQGCLIAVVLPDGGERYLSNAQ